MSGGAGEKGSWGAKTHRVPSLPCSLAKYRACSGLLLNTGDRYPLLAIFLSYFAFDGDLGLALAVIAVMFLFGVGVEVVLHFFAVFLNDQHSLTFGEIFIFQLALGTLRRAFESLFIG